MNKFAIFLVSIFSFVACSAAPVEVPDDGVFKVVTTVGMVEDLVLNVGGDLVEVESIMGPGVDPHLYQPSAGDISLMEEADVIFYVGLHLEGKMGEVLESLSKNKPVVAIAEVIPEELLLAGEDSYAYDPHIWFNVELWSQTVQEVQRVLSDFDPENASAYADNALNYDALLNELEKFVNEEIKLLPEEQRVLITAHDAFAYFGKAYGFEVKGIQGISTASDYGLKDLEALIDFIVERQIKAIFVETSVSSKPIESLKEGVSAKGHEIVIGGELFSDAMGDSGTPEGTYIGMVEHNVRTIVEALK